MNVVLGGKEIVVGSAEYVINLRQSAYLVNGDSYEKRYENSGKDFIYPHDAAESVLTSITDNGPIIKSIEKLINILSEKEMNDHMLTDYKKLPSLTGKELSNTLKHEFYDNDRLIEINKKLKELATMLNIDISLDELEHAYIPEGIVPKSRYNDKGLMEMEEKLTNYICTLEKNQGILAFNCDRIANEMNREPDIKKYILSSDKIKQMNIMEHLLQNKDKIAKKKDRQHSKPEENPKAREEKPKAEEEKPKTDIQHSKTEEKSKTEVEKPEENMFDLSRFVISKESDIK